MKKATIFLLILLGWTSLFAQSMKYTFNVGEKIDIEQIANVQVDQKLMGMEMAMGTIISNSLTIEVESVEGDVAKLKSWYTNVAMDFDISMGTGDSEKLHVNSNEAPSDPNMLEAHNLIKSMVNEPFYIHLRNNGEIVQIDGIDALEAKMRASVTDEETLKNLGKDFSQEKLRADFARFFVPYPNQGLTMGTSWTSPISLPDLQLFDGEQYWRVDRIDSENNEIVLFATVNDIKLNKQENQVEMDIGGNMNTLYKVSDSTGWPRVVTMTSNMTGTAKMDQDGEEYSWPLDMKMNSQITFTRN